MCRIHSWQNNPIPISVCKFAGYTNNQKKEKISPDEPPISNLLNTIAIPALYSKAGPEKSSIWVAKAEKSWSIWVYDWGRMRSGALWECSKPLSKTDGCGNFVESLYIRGDRVVLPRFWDFNNIGNTFVFNKLSLRFLINLLAQSRWLETRSLFAVWFHRELLASFALVFRSCLLARLFSSRSPYVSVFSLASASSRLLANRVIVFAVTSIVQLSSYNVDWWDLLPLGIALTVSSQACWLSGWA